MVTVTVIIRDTVMKEAMNLEVESKLKGRGIEIEVLIIIELTTEIPEIRVILGITVVIVIPEDQEM